MVRYYPEADCCFYVERVVPGAERPTPIKTRRPAPPPAEVGAWGYGEAFEAKTGMLSGDKPQFLECRRRNVKLPIAGRRRLFAIHRTGPAGMENAAVARSKLLEWREAVGLDRKGEKVEKAPKGKKGKGKGKDKKKKGKK